MARNKNPLPALFQRGKKKFWYFRMKIASKDTWVNTETADKSEAIEFQRKYVDAKNVLKVKANIERSANKLADGLVKSITGQEVVHIALDDVFDIWLEHNHHLHDIAENTLKRYKYIFSKFAEWCKSQDIVNIEQVDRKKSMEYAKQLWQEPRTRSSFNDHIKLLDRIFKSFDALYALPERNPFDIHIIPRKRKTPSSTAGHLPVEPEQLQHVINTAAEYGKDYLDLFIIGSQTGMRLKDAVLLKWEYIDENGVIDFAPHKTDEHGNIARLPVSKTLAIILEARAANGSEYVIPDLARQYEYNSQLISDTSTEIFAKAFGGRENIIVPKGKHRCKDTCVISFHSFRTTFMSLMALRDVSTRDAMKMLGWTSPEMIKVYEKMLKKAQHETDKRARIMMDSMDELQYEIPIPTESEKVFEPTPEILAKLIPNYSNVDIGRIFGISDVAIKKRMKKHGIRRSKRIISNATDEELEIVRQKLMEQL